MPRTISIDSVQVIQIQVVKESDGSLRVYAHYSLKGGNEVVRPVYRDMTSRLSAARKAAAQSVFDGIAQDVASLELA